MFNVNKLLLRYKCLLDFLYLGCATVKRIPCSGGKCYRDVLRVESVLVVLLLGALLLSVVLLLVFIRRPGLQRHQSPKVFSSVVFRST